MDGRKVPAKSCEVQHLPATLPDKSWDVERLGKYAQELCQSIERQDQQLTRAYWQLGQALMIAKQSFSHGQWGQFLKHWGISTTRASRARAICRSFPSEQEAAQHTATGAYAQRQRKLAKGGKRKVRASAPAGELAPTQEPLETAIPRLLFETQRWPDEAAFAEPSLAERQLSAIAELIAHLQQVHEALKARVTSRTPQRIKAE